MPTTSQSVLLSQIGCDILIQKWCFLLRITRQNYQSNIQISLHSFYWRKLTHICSTIEEHNFSIGHHILLSFTFQYRHRICWARCNPLTFSPKRAGPNHGTEISNTVFAFYHLDTRDFKIKKSLSQSTGLTSHVSYATSFYIVFSAWYLLSLCLSSAFKWWNVKYDSLFYSKVKSLNSRNSAV